jgi:uroporphyrinogen decarboxylase
MRTALRGSEPDRVPIADGFWEETIDLWRAQGHLAATDNPFEFFGLEWRLVHFDSGLMFGTEDLEATDDFIVRRNSYGTVGRFLRTRSAPAELLEFPIRHRGDWDRLRDRMRWHPDRFGLTGFYSFTRSWSPPVQDWDAKMAGLAEMRATRNYIALYTYDAFEATWRKMGHERALVALAEDPVWMREMFESHIDLLIEGYAQMVRSGASVDGLFMASDLALRTGPMFSPVMHRELCVPGLKRLCNFLHSHDTDLIFHCDGDVRPLIPNLVEAGIDCLQPMEVHAGVDVRELKAEYGDRLAFMGNIGHDEMLLPDDEMEAVIADKIAVAGRGGGYIYHSDHSIAPDVPFEQYMKVLDVVHRHGAPRR